MLGLLIFAKEAPKMISDMLGIKEGGIGSLNPFSRLKDVAGAGIIGGAAAVGMKGVGAVAGGLSGGIAASRRGGSFWAGAGQGAKTGFGNIKVKDAAKGGVTGIGKSFTAGTFGAANKGGSYAAGKVTGREEKVGIANMVKEQMAVKGQEMHVEAAKKAELNHYNDLVKRQKETGSYYQNASYTSTVANLKKAKEDIKGYTSQRQQWANRYQSDPNGTYTGVDGNKHTYKEAYDLANSNYDTAQKNLEFQKGELERMDKMPMYKSDAEDRKLIDKFDAQKKASDRKFNNVQDINVNDNDTFSGGAGI
jgi:hypothetical protein